MPAQWTADILAKMHMNCITSLQLANRLGYRREYVSQILNGHRSPKGAEEKFRTALEELVGEKTA